MNEAHHPRDNAADQDTDEFSNAQFEYIGPSQSDIQTDEVVMPISIESFITPRTLLADPDWINKHVIAKGRGTEAYIARIFGVCRVADIKTNEWQGKQLESVCLTGIFEAENYVSGKLVRSRSLYIPNMYAKQVLEALATSPEGSTAPMDLLLGVRATGKTIPYTWTVTSFIDDGMGAELDAMRNKRHPMLDRFISSTQRLIAAH